MYESRAPDSEARIEILERWIFDDARVRVELATPRGRIALYDGREDWILGYSRTQWLESGRVAVYACNRIGQSLLMGYDLRAHRRLEPDAVRDVLRRGLQGDYAKEIERSRYANDPLSWACSNEGTAAIEARAGNR